MTKPRWLTFGALGVFAIAAGGLAEKAGADPRPVSPAAAHGIVLMPTDQGVRVSVDVSAEVAARRFFLEGANPRFVVDLPGVVWRPVGMPRGRGEGAGAGPAAGFRYAEHSTGVSRLVLDLAGPGRLVRETQEPLPRGGRRLIFEVAAGPIVQTAPRPAPDTIGARVHLASAGTEPSLIPAQPPAPQSGRRVIVIDPGHGGRDPGAIGPSGVREKDVVLHAGLRLRALLERTGRYEVVMTRDADVFVELPDRVGFARRQDADLFVSLHADASPNPQARGVSIYTLSERGTDRARRMMNSQNWRVDLGEAPHDGVVGAILVDLTQRETTNRSAAFAQTVIERMRPVAPLLTNTHRNAGFFVLLAPDVPAVLIEMGFLTNAQDEQRLADEAEREAMMRALARAIDDHFLAGMQFAAADVASR